MASDLKTLSNEGRKLLLQGIGDEHESKSDPRGDGDGDGDADAVQASGARPRKEAKKGVHVWRMSLCSTTLGEPVKHPDPTMAQFLYGVKNGAWGDYELSVVVRAAPSGVAVGDGDEEWRRFVGRHQKGVPARAPGWGEDLAGLGLDTPAKVLWQVCRFGRMSSRYAPRGEQYQPELGPGADAAEVSEMQLAMDNLAARYAARHPGGPVPGSGVGVPMAGELLDPLLEAVVKYGSFGAAAIPDAHVPLDTAAAAAVEGRGVRLQVGAWDEAWNVENASKMVCFATPRCWFAIHYWCEHAGQTP